MAGLPDSTFGKWTGFLAGLLSLAGLVVPSIKESIHADYVELGAVAGAAISGFRFYKHRYVKNISIGQWCLKIIITLVLAALWIFLVSIGNPEIIKGIEVLNNAHYYVIEYFAVYSLISGIVIAFLVYFIVDILLSFVFSR